MTNGIGSVQASFITQLYPYEESWQIKAGPFGARQLRDFYGPTPLLFNRR
jgi:hypothetical protein